MPTAFLLDGMLGSLTRWLRICGFEAVYAKNVPDERLLERARSDELILLTRDRDLSGKAQREGVEALLVEGATDTEKLAFISRRFKLSLNPTVSRCPSCGGDLDTVEKEVVRGTVPDRSIKVYDEFWACRSCGQVYWRGSHWPSIVETVERASRLASESSKVSEQNL
jgi:uncharacterized protein with PIN domain